MTCRYDGRLFGLEGDLNAAHDLRTRAHADERVPFVVENEWFDDSLPLGGENGPRESASRLEAESVCTPARTT